MIQAHAYSACKCDIDFATDSANQVKGRPMIPLFDECLPIESNRIGTP
jgi:hypothetical protein